MVKKIPRKALSEKAKDPEKGSPRITVRITDEIKEILEQQDDKSEFIR